MPMRGELLAMAYAGHQLGRSYLNSVTDGPSFAVRLSIATACAVTSSSKGRAGRRFPGRATDARHSGLSANTSRRFKSEVQQGSIDGMAE